MIVLNIFGSPGSGKSTLAAKLFYRFKEQHFNVELVTEQAKNFTWSERHIDLACQPYVFAKQLRDIWRLKDKVDLCITDSPLLMSLAYTGDEWPKSYKSYVLDQFQQFNNYNLFLLPNNNYSEVGRNQSYNEALLLSEKIHKLVLDNSVIHDIIDVEKMGTTQWGFDNLWYNLSDEMYARIKLPKFVEEHKELGPEYF